MPGWVYHGNSLTCKGHCSSVVLRGFLHFFPHVVVHRSTHIKPRSTLSQASLSSGFLNRCNFCLTFPETVNVASSRESGVCWWDLMSSWCLEKCASWEEEAKGSLVWSRTCRLGQISPHTFLPFPSFITPAPGWEKLWRAAMRVKSEPGTKEVSILLPECSYENLGW